MRYLQNPKRDDPRRILPSAKSVICVGLVYNTPDAYSTELSASGGSRQKAVGSENEDGPRGWISRYAWGEDYHEVLCAKLEKLRAAIEELAPGVEMRVYVDTGPIVERAFARYSGIGWMGKNTCLINEAKGSWFFLGVMLSSLEIAPDLLAPDRCGSCTACLEACPTGALVEPYVMDASRCISYLTIELKGAIPTKFRSAVGANVFGCDICQDVCPWNRKTSDECQVTSNRQTEISTGTKPQRREVAVTRTPELHPLLVTPKAESRPFSLFNPPLEALAAISDEDFHRIFARSPVKRVRYRGWLRNLCVAMGNSGDSRHVPWLERTREHSDPVVREHAQWALERLTSSDNKPPGTPGITPS